MYDLSQGINHAVTSDVFRGAHLEAINKSITRLSTDPAARGDVGTHLTRPRSHVSVYNQWVHEQADAVVLDIMQTVIDHTIAHAGNDGQVPDFFRDWTVINESDRSRRHAAFKLYVVRRLNVGRSVFVRVLYNEILYYMVHRNRNNVGIFMSYPDVEKPDASNGVRHQYYAYTKSFVVGGAARMRDGDRETDERDGSRVRQIMGCLMQDSALVLHASAGRRGLPNAPVAAFADMMRGIVIDTEYDWDFATTSDDVESVTAGPGVWRLLLPRLSTRGKIDTLKWDRGLC